VPKLAWVACKGTPRAASEILNRHHEGACGLSGVAESGIALSLANAGALDQQRMRFVKLASMAP
jgi:hypothetical protein